MSAISAQDINVLLVGFQGTTSFVMALGFKSDVIIHPKRTVQIVVTPNTPEVIGDRPRPDVLKARHILLTDPPAFAEVIGFSKPLLQEIPRLWMNMMANIVPFGIGGGDFESFRKVAFAQPVRSNFKVKLLRVAHGLIVGFGQRIVVTAQRVQGADQIEGHASVRDAPDAGSRRPRRMNWTKDRCKQSTARKNPQGGTCSRHEFGFTNRF
jgi:hypothetical protein